MYDIAGEHAVAMGAAVALPVFLWLVLRAISALAHRGVGWAVALRDTYQATSAITRLAAVLMLVSGVIHFVLIPSHEGLTAVLFLVNGVGFIVLGIAAFFTSWWRRPAVLWLV